MRTDEGGCQEWLTVRPAAYKVTDRRSGAIALLAPPRHEPLGVLTDSQVGALQELASGPVRAADLAVGASDDERGQIRALVERLRVRGWLSVSVRCGADPLYTIKPFGRAPERLSAPPARPRLSKFTVVRRHRGEIVVENPRAWGDVHVHDARVLTLVSGLRAPQAAELPQPAAERVLSDLLWVGCLVDDEAEDEQLALRQWSSHELWFHHRTTIGNRGWNWEPFAATNWARGEFDPLPAQRPPHRGRRVALAVPDLERRRREDITVAAAIDDRHSCRAFDDSDPITVDELAELLHRSARTRGWGVVDGREVCSRPYPSGGGVYELELYPVVRHVAGLARGMYHYDSVEHALRAVADGDDAVVHRLLHSASYTLADRQLPQVLIVVAARSGRLMWTYEQLSYALILKHVGALSQTMYLVATAMGLGSIALGTGEAAAFAEAIGADQTEECAVGDFAVGRPYLPHGYRGLWDGER